MSGSRLIGQLIEALRTLPGVGPKSAQRMAYHLLERDREGGRRLAAVLRQAMEHVGHCRDCRTLSEEVLCALCASDRRDRSQLCVVETPADVLALEQSTGYQGVYFVLMGHLSPLDGVGPEELGLDRLEARLQIGEIAHAHGIRATRIAHGVPMGGELEYIDGNTLSHAFAGRREV